MKRIFSILAAALFSLLSIAQSPEMMSYQAIIRDMYNHLITNTQVGVQISIVQTSTDGSIVYAETQTPTTNANGLLSIEVGEGTLVSGDFSSIDWSAGEYFIKTETDPLGGTAYTISGISQLLSVPYALHSKTAESLSGTYDESDPVFSTSPANSISTDDIGSWNTKLNNEEDGSITNELQALSISNDTVFLSDGGFIKIPYGPSEADNLDLISFDGTNWVAKRAIVQNTGLNQAQNNMQPFLAINHIIALQGIFPSRNGIEPFLAEIIMFGGNFAPRGWALCDGQLLPVSQNTAVFSLLGTMYGGNGITTFALPDLRGRTAIHPGRGPGLSPRIIGQRGGTETNTMTVGQMPAHTHTINYE